jgi:cytochrome c553
MRKCGGMFVLAVLSIGVVAFVAAGQNQKPAPDAFPWAYGFAKPGPDPVAPPCPPNAKPHDCSWPGRPWPNDGTVFHLPGTDRTFTISQIQSFWAPADWYPNEHPPAPDIVKYGHENLHLRACGHCHYFNGQGKPENGHLAGLSYNYILQQLALFKSGGRKSADPRKANVNEMIQIARFLTDDEAKAAARYYSSLTFHPWVKVVESTTAPKTRQSPAGAFIPLPGGETEPLGDGIIEVPQNPDRTEHLRDPHSGYIAYVPVGSIEKGKLLATTGGSGKTIGCDNCHGENLTGGRFGEPPIAGRTTSYLVRQLDGFKRFTRNGPGAQLMRPAVQNLSDQDILDIAAYVASLNPCREPADSGCSAWMK